MKNKKGFTLIETLGTIILLAVILMIAVPSINNVVEANKKRRFREATEMFTVLAKNKLETDTSINYPSPVSTKVVVLFLDSIDKKQLENIVGEGVTIGNSTTTPLRTSKAVFSYSGSKWELKFVVLYDGEGNAAYLDSGKIISGEDNNSTLNSSDKYTCVDSGKGYCYADK